MTAPLRQIATLAVLSVSVLSPGRSTVSLGAEAAKPTPSTRAEKVTARALELTVTKSFKETGGGQQGIATDGKHVYVQSTFVLTKYDLRGKRLANGDKQRWHHGGIAYHDGKIYAAVSECVKTGTRKHWVYVYDAETLEKVAEHDVGKKFGVCAGGIAYHDHYFYVGESYFDNDHDDYVVQFDTDFKPVRSYRVRFKCPYGIQGLTYLPSAKKFMVNSHGRAFYLIDTKFDSRTIEPGRAPFALQDVACLDRSTVLINDRSGKRVVFARLND